MLEFVLLSVFGFLPLVHSGTIPEGGSCSTDNDHLDPLTHKFLTECDDKTFCSGSVNGTCVMKKCRRDEFPFGFNPGDTLPPLCQPGTFCPDECGGCQALVDVGGTCQMNRDEQCGPPHNWEKIASFYNSNGSVCLQSTCTFANVTLGQRCVLDNTTYVDTGADGRHISNTIFRDNCRTPMLYCDQTYLQCLPTKLVGSPCASDQECQTYNCDNNVCIDPPETPLKVAPWHSAIIAFCIFAAIASICTLLVTVHKRQRLHRYREIRDYYSEQMSLRRTIVALHSQATDKASIYGDSRNHQQKFHL